MSYTVHICLPPYNDHRLANAIEFFYYLDYWNSLACSSKCIEKSNLKLYRYSLFSAIKLHIIFQNSSLKRVHYFHICSKMPHWNPAWQVKTKLLFPLFLLDFFPTFFSQNLLHTGKMCWWMKLSYNVSCWQLWRYEGAIYSQHKCDMLRSVPQMSQKPERSLKELRVSDGTGKSLALHFYFFLMYNYSKDGLKCLSNKNWLFRPLYQGV